MSDGYMPDFSKASPRWSLMDTRAFTGSPQTLKALAYEAIRLIAGETLKEEAPGRWRGQPVRPFSLFDDWTVAIDILESPVPGNEITTSSTVSVEITFDMTSARMGWFVLVVSTIIGSPFAYLWRAKSIRDARAFSQRVFASVWSTLTARGQEPYRASVAADARPIELERE